MLSGWSISAPKNPKGVRSGGGHHGDPCDCHYASHTGVAHRASAGELFRGVLPRRDLPHGLLLMLPSNTWPSPLLDDLEDFDPSNSILAGIIEATNVPSVYSYMSKKETDVSKNEQKGRLFLDIIFYFSSTSPMSFSFD